MKGKLNVILKDEANLDVIEAYLYYENELDGLGERFLNELKVLIKQVRQRPKGFQKIDKFHQAPFNIFPFVIIYELSENDLIVYAVFQTKQNPSRKIKSV